MKQINRRQALKQAGYIMGAAISAPVVSGILSGCTAKPKVNWKPSFFSEEQAQFIIRLTDIILPKTETAGAVELGVPEFIDEMIAYVYTDRKEDFAKGYTAFNTECMEATGSAFLDLDDEAQVKYLNEINGNLVDAMEASDGPNFFYTMKEMTITGYFTTEVGMTQILQYKAIPTEYNGCITVEEAGGKTWAT
jgi:hypothetical protein